MVAPCSAAPLPAFAAPSMKDLSFRIASGAPVMAPPWTPTAFKRKSLLFRSSGAASAKAVPKYFVASSTSASSARISGEASFKAAPWLVKIALFTRSRSFFTCSGAFCRSFQSSNTAALHKACRQLDKLEIAEDGGSKPSSSCLMPALYSAAFTPLRITDDAASWERSTSPSRRKDAAMSRLSSASSAAGKSFAMLNSLRSLSALFLLVMIAAFALRRNQRPGMSR
mmetsp:Transcript_64484/g.133629  ORF Transcript_64484/g.133629 Transcript_64484/m.133629 type:complete len:226 (-) Transcript_64484:455-1132(-)